MDVGGELDVTRIGVFSRQIWSKGGEGYKTVPLVMEFKFDKEVRK